MWLCWRLPTAPPPHSCRAARSRVPGHPGCFAQDLAGPAELGPGRQPSGGRGARLPLRGRRHSRSPQCLSEAESCSGSARGARSRETTLVLHLSGSESLGKVGALTCPPGHPPPQPHPPLLLPWVPSPASCHCGKPWPAPTSPLSPENSTSSHPTPQKAPSVYFRSCPNCKTIMEAKSQQ